MNGTELFFGSRDEKLNNALQIFGKSNQDLDQDIDILKNWLASQPHLPEIPSNIMICTINSFHK